MRPAAPAAPAVPPPVAPAADSSHGRGVLGLAGWLLVSFAAGAGGGIASARAAELYVLLDRPAWAPPAWLFGPVWTVLYAMMGVAAWLVWRERGWRGARVGLTLFLLQLVPNALWTWTFFVQRRAAWATADLAVLLVLLVATLVAFARVRRSAALLLVPYLAWAAFAGALTLALWRRNPALLG